MGVLNSWFSVLSCSTIFLATTVAWFFWWQQKKEKQTNLQLKIIHDNLDFALQSGHMGTWDIRLDDNTVTCSPEMLALWGVTDKEYSRKRGVLQSKVHPDDIGKMDAAIESAIAGNGIYELEYRIFPKPGQMRWVLSRGRCAFVPGSKKPERFSGVVFDITENKMREAELEQAIRIRDQFLMIAGHELKTPLTNLHMQVQLRQRDLQRNNLAAFTPEKISAVLTEQLTYVRRLSHVVDSLVDASQIAEGQLNLSLEYFDICKLVRDVVERFRDTASGISIEFNLAPTQSVYGHWDWFRIEQVLVNLLSNALKYGNGKPVEIRFLATENHVKLVVRDHGRGIPLTDHERIFRRFERAINENEVSGTGLGLYIAQNIVHLHGGEIRVFSKEGDGAEFIVTLPLEREASL